MIECTEGFAPTVHSKASLQKQSFSKTSTKLRFVRAFGGFLQILQTEGELSEQVQIKDLYL